MTVTSIEYEMMNDSDSDFSQIYTAFQPKILRYVARLLNEAEAEDITQDVFIKVREGLQSFRGESQLSTWIYRIATNAALDRLRSPSYQRTVEECSQVLIDSEAGIIDQNTWTGEEAPLVEHRVFRREMNDCIQGLIQKLPEDHRTVLLLSEFDGLRDKEIADILGVTSGTVKIRLHRARERMKRELEQNCDSYWIEENEFIPELKIR